MNAPATPVLSVIVPAFNMERYLADGLRSMEGVSPGALEVIVIDDGSTDATGALAERWAARVRTTGLAVQIIRKPNGHYGSCINAALAVATGAYVRTLDADDTYDPAELQRFITVLSNEKNAGRLPDAYVTDYVWTDASRSEIARHEFALATDTMLSLADLAKLPFGLSVQALTYRTDFLRELGYRQTEGIAYSDNDWALLPVLHLATARYVKACVYRYLCGRDGQSVSRASRCRDNAHILTLLRRYLCLRAQMSLSGAAENYFRTKVVPLICDYLQVVFIDAPLRDVASSADALFALLGEADSTLLAAAEDRLVVCRSLCPVRFVCVWRRLRFGRAAWVCLVRLQVRLARFLSRSRG